MVAPIAGVAGKFVLNQALKTGAGEGVKALTGNDDKTAAAGGDQAGGLPPPLDKIPGAQVAGDLMKKLGIGG